MELLRVGFSYNFQLQLLNNDTVFFALNFMCRQLIFYFQIFYFTFQIVTML